MSEARYCDGCHRNVDTGCNCGLTFAEKIQGVQVGRFSLYDKDRKIADPHNRGINRKLK